MQGLCAVQGTCALCRAMQCVCNVHYCAEPCNLEERLGREPREHGGGRRAVLPATGT